jgi:hypothetical protein
MAVKMNMNFSSVNFPRYTKYCIPCMHKVLLNSVGQGCLRTGCSGDCLDLKQTGG